MRFDYYQKRKACFLTGVFLLCGSTFFWISHIIAMANNFDRWSDALLSAVLVTSIPVSLGIISIWYGRKTVK